MFVDSPRCRECQIFGRHSRGQSSVPSCKGVARLGRVGRSSDCSAVVSGDGIDSRATIAIEGNEVRVGCERTADGYIAVRHCGWNILPTIEFVAGLGRIAGGKNRRTKLNILNNLDGVVIGNINNVVFVDSPRCRKCQIFGRHCFWQSSVPSCKGVARLGRGSRCGDCSSV